MKSADVARIEDPSADIEEIREFMREVENGVMSFASLGRARLALMRLERIVR